MKLLLENWRKYQEEESLKEGLLKALGASLYSDLISLISGTTPDNTIGFLLGKLRKTDTLKNLKGPNLIKLLKLQLSSISKLSGDIEIDAPKADRRRQLEQIIQYAEENPQSTLEDIVNAGIKHSRGEGRGEKATGMDNISGLLGGLVTMANQLSQADQRPALAEELYYGTSTVFQEEIAENGIKAPSEWGDYGLAEKNAMNIVDQFGGEPMVIQMAISEFENKSLTLQENYDKMYIYTDKLNINIRKQEKINL